MTPSDGTVLVRPGELVSVREASRNLYRLVTFSDAEKYVLLNGQNEMVAVLMPITDYIRQEPPVS